VFVDDDAPVLGVEAGRLGKVRVGAHAGGGDDDVALEHGAGVNVDVGVVDVGHGRRPVRNVSAALNPAGPLPMAMKPGATTFPGYHFGGSNVALVSDLSHLLSDDGLVGRVLHRVRRATPCCSRPE